MNVKIKEILLTPLPMFWTFLALFVALLVLWGWYSSNLILRQERSPNTSLPAAFGAPYEDVTFRARDGVELSGWFVPAKSPTDVTLVACHGWGTNRSDILPATIFLALKGGYNLFYFDFRNHGESGGNTSSLLSLEMRDLEAALDTLKATRPGQSRRIGVYGLSMGGAVCLSVAARRPEIEAVAAESPFSSYNGVVARHGRLLFHLPRFPLTDLTITAVKWRLGHSPQKDSPVFQIAKIAPRPVLLIQAEDDVRMPPSEGQTLYAHAKEPKELWVVHGAGHGEVSAVAGEEFERRLLAFYGKAFGR